MKSIDFINKLKRIATLPTIYYSGGDRWSEWNGRSWNFDCVVSVKSVLWDWHEDKEARHGGAIYRSNGVPDFTCDGGLDYCKEVSTNFSNLAAGEYLCMKGSGYGHVGVYLGEGKVFEVTTAWGVNGATISDIDKYGNRSRNGIPCLKWTYHGKLTWIEYNEEKPSTLYNIGDNVKINKVYVSSESTNPLVPLINEGKITRIIKGARNPYLLDDGNIGWVNDECIVKEHKSEPIYKVVTNCYYLNLRTTPTYGDNIYSVVPAGTTVEYLYMEDGWAKIKYNNRELYCGASYLK